MKHATHSDLKEIYRALHKHPELQHVRQDKLKRMIEKGLVVWQDGVAITFQQYRKKTRVGDIDVPRGAIMIHQIVNSGQFNGAGGRVFEQFVDEVVKPSGGDLYLSVRKENDVACSFYERHDMSVVGKVDRSGGTLPGLVYKLSPVW